MNKGFDLCLYFCIRLVRQRYIVTRYSPVKGCGLFSKNGKVDGRTSCAFHWALFEKPRVVRCCAPFCSRLNIRRVADAPSRTLVPIMVKQVQNNRFFCKQEATRPLVCKHTWERRCCSSYKQAKSTQIGKERWVHFKSSVHRMLSKELKFHPCKI